MGLVLEKSEGLGQKRSSDPTVDPRVGAVNPVECFLDERVQRRLGHLRESAFALSASISSSKLVANEARPSTSSRSATSSRSIPASRRAARRRSSRSASRSTLRSRLP